MPQAVKLPYQRQIYYSIFIILALTLFLNGLYRHSLYSIGVQMIVRSQSASNWVLNWFFMIITMTIDPFFVFVGVITMIVLSHRKQKGFVMFMFILFNTFWAALIKAFHCDPRPFWTNNQVKNIGIYCPIEYGNPSGHSWFSVILGFGVFMQYRGVGKRNRNILYSILMVIFVPMSRMYLGAHSLNQVLQGLIWGICMCLFFRLGLKQLFHKFLTQFNHNKRWKLLIIVLHILCIIPFVTNMDGELPQKWLININKKCIKDMNESRLNQLMFSINALILNLATGVGLGYEQLVKCPNGAYYLTGNWRINTQKYGSVKGWIYYVCIQVWFMICGLVVALVFFKIFPTFITGYIGVCIGGLVSGYMFTSRTVMYLNKYHIIVKYKPKTQQQNEAQNLYFLDKTDEQKKKQRLQNQLEQTKVKNN